MSDIDKQDLNEGEEDPDDSQNKSVSLDDNKLGGIDTNLKINMNFKIKGMDSIL